VAKRRVALGSDGDRRYVKKHAKHRKAQKSFGCVLVLLVKRRWALRTVLERKSSCVTREGARGARLEEQSLKSKTRVVKSKGVRERCDKRARAGDRKK